MASSAPVFRHRSSALLCSVVALLCVQSAPAAAQDQHAWCRDTRLQRNQVCEVRQLRFTPSATQLAIDTGPNGSIEVEAYEGREVRVTARVLARAGSENASWEMARDVAVRAAGGEIRADGPRRTGNNSWSVSVRVQVPAGTAIDARTTNGSITVAGSRAPVTAQTTNGSIRLADVARRAQVRSTNGSIRVALSADDHAIENMELRTTNGSVQLTVPARIAADVELATTNGSITTDVPVAVQGRVTRRQLSGTLGGGGPLIRIRTTNGAIRIGAH